MIELLTTTVIVGLLAALAIPSFLQAAGQGGDAAAKAQAAVAQLAAEALATENAGSYAATSRSALHRYEPSIATSRTTSGAYLSAASGRADAFTLTVTSTLTGDKFTIARTANGAVRRTCKVPSRQAPQNGCTHVRGTRGSW